MDFLRAGLPYDADNLAAGCPANDGVVHQHHPLSIEQAANGVQLQLDTEITDGLAGLDERPADVVVADEAEPERDAGFIRVADGGGNARVGHGHHQVRLHGMLAGEQPPQHLAARLHGTAENDAVRTRKVNVFENALRVLNGRRETQ